MAGSTVTEAVSPRPTTTRMGLRGVMRNCRSQPSCLSSATPVPEPIAAPSAPYAAIPTIDAIFHSMAAPPAPTPMLVISTYINTGIPMPNTTKPRSRRVRRTSSRM